MAHAVNWFDRLRIERAVWSLDQRIYDLPRKSRIAKRREVRENLLAAAHDIGTAHALRHPGNSRELAAGYLSAVFGVALHLGTRRSGATLRRRDQRCGSERHGHRDLERA